MRRFRKAKEKIKASQELGRGITFTAKEVVQFLSHIVELMDRPVSYKETPDGILEIYIGDSVYHIADIG